MNKKRKYLIAYKNNNYEIIYCKRPYRRLKYTFYFETIQHDDKEIAIESITEMRDITTDCLVPLFTLTDDNIKDIINNYNQTHPIMTYRELNKFLLSTYGFSLGMDYILKYYPKQIYI